ncbi:hypothetical protein [Roseateles sp. BYS96W]|uniref:Uncharacterized protein n=1 Tax=Pelomonas nitida TaxID=3299027 RepID=A0ABW7G4V8_9BURK
MASFALQVVPTSLGQSPSNEKLALARDLLSSYISYSDDTIRVAIFSKPTLVDTGVAFENIECPLCHSIISRFEGDEHDEWWDDMETKISESESPLQQALEMPCCSQAVRAEQLNFKGAARFVNWMLRANDYELHSERMNLEKEQLAAIEKVLGCEVTELIGVNG